MHVASVKHGKTVQHVTVIGFGGVTSDQETSLAFDRMREWRQFS